jgi:hypothetical protein
MDVELAAARANLRRLRDNAVAEHTAMVEVERNPYHREFLLDQIEKMRAIGKNLTPPL